MRTDYTYQPRDNVFNERDAKLIDIISEKCPSWIPEIDKIRNGEIKNYVEADRLLFSVALDVGSSWIDHHKGLDKEVKTVRELYPSKLK